MDGSVHPPDKTPCTSPPGTHAQASVAGDIAGWWHPHVFSGGPSTDFLPEASARTSKEMGTQTYTAPACGRNDLRTFLFFVAVSVMQFTWDFYVIP